MADGTVPPAGEKREFYVYILYRPDKRPCYVGKGKGDRWKRHQWRAKRKLANPHLENILRSAGGTLPMEKAATNLTEAESFEFERFLIREIGREITGGPLVNLTDGGEGPSGFKFPRHIVERISAQKRGKSAVWNIGRVVSEKTRTKMRMAKLGTIQSDETKQKRGDKLRGKRRDPAIGLKVSAARKGKPLTEEHRAALRAASRGKDPDVRARISAATKAAMAILNPEKKTRMIEGSRRGARERARKYRTGQNLSQSDLFE